MKKKAVVFGMGEKFFRYHKDILKEYDVIAIVDNDKQKSSGGGRVYGVCIYDPLYLEKLEYDCILVVAGNHKVEIMQQLVGMGIDENKIVPWFPDGGHEWKRKQLSLHGDCLLAEMDDLKFKLQHSSDILAFEEIYLRNTYGYHYAGNGACIAIDIGMNIGLTTLLLANRSEISHVYSFEPFPDTFKQAESNIAMNPQLQTQITAFNYGLSNTDIVQRVPYNQDFPGGMRTGEADGTVTSEDGVEIRLRDASSVLKEIFEANKEKNIVVKIDCEGSEYSIFDSLKKSGLLGVPHIYIMESHDGREQELLAELRESGYTYFAPYDGRDGLGCIYAVKYGH